MFANIDGEKKKKRKNINHVIDDREVHPDKF